MSYRTLEEKFLADLEKTEEANKILVLENRQLREALSEESVNKVLDAAVRAAGRREVMWQVMPEWHRADALGNNFDEWVKESAFENRLPSGVSMGEFIAYFDKELTAAYEDKYAEDTKEESE